MPSLYPDFASLLLDLHNPEDAWILPAIAIATAASAQSRYSPEGCSD